MVDNISSYFSKIYILIEAPSKIAQIVLAEELKITKC